MNPVRTRQDCCDWLTLDEVETEVFGAFTGALQHIRHHDFAADASADGGSGLQDGTLLTPEGEPWVRCP